MEWHNEVRARSKREEKTEREKFPTILKEEKDKG